MKKETLPRVDFTYTKIKMRPDRIFLTNKN